MNLRLLMAFAFCLALPFGLVAQEDAPLPRIPAHLDAAPQLQQLQLMQASPSGARALWDVQLSANLTDTAQGDAGMAAAYYFEPNDEFWVSRWQSDTLYRFDSNGSLLQEFVVPGLIGTRAFTSDGTFLYAATASNTIFRINPNTQQLAPPHIAHNTTVTSRHCSYDAQADNGNGGFWVGNFNTDIVLIDMNGTPLVTIPTATHGLSGMYGSAIDYLSTGGPYLWVFHQGGTSQAVIDRLQLPAGTPTGVTRDVLADFGTTFSLASGLAGGLFITDDLVPGENTIGGLLQGNPNNILFAYELSDPNTTDPDMAATGVSGLEYASTPIEQTSTLNFELNYENSSPAVADTLRATFTLTLDGNTVWSDIQSTTNVAAGATGSFTSASYTPSQVGDYELTATLGLGAGQTDLDGSNNSSVFTFVVSDSVMARAQAPYLPNGYQVSAASSGFAGALYSLPNADTLTGIEISVLNATDGDTTYAMVFSLSGGVPDAMIAQGPAVLFQTGVEDYYLDFDQDVVLAAGDYVMAVYEGANTGLGLKQSESIFTAGSNFFFVNGTWTPSGIPTARYLNPVFGEPNIVISTEEAELAALGIHVFPNPTDAQVTVDLSDAEAGVANLRVYNTLGQPVLEQQLATGGQEQLDLGRLVRGAYVLEIQIGDQRQTLRLMKQ